MHGLWHWYKTFLYIKYGAWEETLMEVKSEDKNWRITKSIVQKDICVIVLMLLFAKDLVFSYIMNSGERYKKIHWKLQTNKNTKLLVDVYTLINTRDKFLSLS